MNFFFPISCFLLSFSQQQRSSDWGPDCLNSQGHSRQSPDQSNSKHPPPPTPHTPTEIRHTGPKQLPEPSSLSRGSPPHLLPRTASTLTPQGPNGLLPPAKPWSPVDREAVYRLHTHPLLPLSSQLANQGHGPRRGYLGENKHLPFSSPTHAPTHSSQDMGKGGKGEREPGAGDVLGNR